MGATGRSDYMLTPTVSTTRDVRHTTKHNHISGTSTDKTSKVEEQGAQPSKVGEQGT